MNKILMKDCLSKTIAAVDVDRLTPYDFFFANIDRGKIPMARVPNTPERPGDMVLFWLKRKL